MFIKMTTKIRVLLNYIYKNIPKAYMQNYHCFQVKTDMNVCLPRMLYKGSNLPGQKRFHFNENNPQLLT
jgi:hypothetical protein